MMRSDIGTIFALGVAVMVISPNASDATELPPVTVSSTVVEEANNDGNQARYCELKNALFQCWAANERAPDSEDGELKKLFLRLLWKS
jgi:hypothetical protein